MLKHTIISTPLGPMVAIGNEKALYLLEFANQRGLQCAIEDLLKQTKRNLVTESTKLLHTLKEELDAYFSHALTHFTTPLAPFGTPFQMKVWKQLQNIPFGETRSYLDIARAIEQEKALRAVGRANGANRLALLIPCHRVIKADNKLGGYAGGCERKEWLLSHEKT